MSEGYYTLNDVSKYYKMRYESVYRWYMKGKIKATVRRVEGYGRRKVLTVTEHTFKVRVPQLIAQSKANTNAGLEAWRQKIRDRKDEEGIDDTSRQSHTKRDGS